MSGSASVPEVGPGAVAGGVAGEPIFLEPVYLTKVWGGSRLRAIFGPGVPDGPIGECLAISARPEGDCAIRGGRFDGLTLSELWSQHPELFGSARGDVFPLQVKVLDARQDLSVQVHPDAAYAEAHEDGAGKNECWYVLDAAIGGQVVLGHSALTRGEFTEMAARGHWAELLRHIEMQRGDFFDVPAGTVHAILAGSLIYEVQQPSNVTYRLFDYDRLDHGEKRELHFDKALDVVAAPSRPVSASPDVAWLAGATREAFPRNKDFSVTRWDVSGTVSVPADAPFLAVSVLAGSGRVNGSAVGAGDHFIVPSGRDTLDLEGPLTLMVATV